MKKFRFSKISAVLLTLALLLSGFFTSAQSVFAANEGTLNIHKLDSNGVTAAEKDASKTYFEKVENGVTTYHEYLAGATYEIYEIAAFTQTTGEPVELVYTVTAGLQDKDGNAITVIDQSTLPHTIDASTATLVKSVTTTDTGAVVAQLDQNKVYLVKETVSPEGVNGSTDFIITVPMFIDGEWLYDIDAYPKNVKSDAKIEKALLDENGDEVSELYANVGDVLDYQVKVTAPLDIESTTYKYTQFEIEDTSSTSLQANPSTVTIASDKGTTYTEGTDYTVSYAGTVLKVTFTEDGIAKIKNGEVLTVTYEATILAGAASNEEGPVVNEVQLNTAIDNEPIDPVVPPVNPPTVKVYSFGMKKVDENAAALADAEFVLAVSDGAAGYTYLKFDAATKVWSDATDLADATGFTTSTTGTGIDSEAILQFFNLEKDGTYFLVERTAPTGYAKLPNPIEFQVTKDTTDVVYASYEEQADGTFVYKAGELGTIGFNVTVKNILDTDVPGQLPSTGGNGIYMFLLAGAALVGVGVILFAVSKKRARG